MSADMQGDGVVRGMVKVETCEIWVVCFGWDGGVECVVWRGCVAWLCDLV